MRDLGQVEIRDQVVIRDAETHQVLGQTTEISTHQLFRKWNDRSQHTRNSGARADS